MKIYTVKELAEHLKIHPQTLYQLIRTGKIKAVRIGNTYRITEEAVQKFLKENEEYTRLGNM